VRGVLTALVVLSIAVTTWFVLRLGNPQRSADPSAAWLWALLGWVTIALDVLLLLILLHIRYPAWVAAAVLTAQDIIYVWRSVRLEKARRADRENS
jgi:hypothetical protein